MTWPNVYLSPHLSWKCICLVWLYFVTVLCIARFRCKSWSLSEVGKFSRRSKLVTYDRWVTSRNYLTLDCVVVYQHNWMGHSENLDLTWCVTRSMWPYIRHSTRTSSAKGHETVYNRFLKTCFNSSAMVEWTWRILSGEVICKQLVKCWSLTLDISTQTKNLWLFVDC